MFLIFLLITFQFHRFCVSQPDPTIIQFDVPYRNFTTKGKLEPNSYEVAPNNDTRPFAVRVVLISRDETLDKPISLVLMRGSSFLSTYIPRIQTYEGASEGYYFMAETLCEERNMIGPSLTEYNDTVRLTVSSSVPAIYDLIVKQVHGFVMGMKPRTVAFSPPEPVFYRFSFPEFVDAVAIRVSSLDNFCGRVTVQRAACPVFDTEGQVVLYDSYNHQTYTQKAFIIVQREEFGDDINIIFSVLPMDTLCQSNNNFQAIHKIFDSQYRVKNRAEYPCFFIVIFHLVALAVVYGVVLYLSRKINNMENPDDEHVDEEKWHLSLSRVLVILPVAVIAIVRHYNSHDAKDTDMYNFNYECSIPIGPFKAFNSMLSASSIFFVSLISIAVTWHVRVPRKFFPLNSCILITGVLWTIMNYCPQKHSFHLFTIAMIMTILEAKFLLFSMQNKRERYHHHYIGTITLTLMAFIIVDSTWENAIIHYVSATSIIAILVISAFFFTYFHENDWFTRTEEYPLIATDTETNQEPVVETQHLRQHHLVPEIQQEQEAPNESIPEIPAPPGYQFVEDVAHDEANREVDSRNSGSQQRLLEAEEQGERPNQPGATDNAQNVEQIEKLRQRWLKAYFLVTLGNIAVWTFYGCVWKHWFDTPIVTLRIIQSDFAFYFLFFCARRLKDIRTQGLLNKNRSKIVWFCVTFGMLILGIFFWWFISTHLLPAYVRWSPAESRVLNQKCLCETMGIDWHDILHYLSAVICLLYMIIVFQISGHRLDGEKTRTRF